MADPAPGATLGANGAPERDAAAVVGEATDAATDQGPDAARFTPTFRVVELREVTVELPATFAVAHLFEAEPPGRHLPIPLGMPDATALASALHRLETPRPLTHVLFADVLRRLQVDVVAVRLVGRTRATYLGELDLMSPRGREVVPCRPSDGLNLALRQPVPAPVLADERLLEGEGDVHPA